jgi:hypothetical protein
VKKTKEFNHWVIEGLKEPFEEEDVTPEQIIEANKYLLLEVLQLRDVSQINLYQMERYIFSDSEPKAASDFKEELKVYCIYFMLQILKRKANLQNPEKDHLHNIYLLAEFRARLGIALHDLKNFDSETDWRHQLKSRYGIDKRWEQQKREYEQACGLASKLWSEGDNRLRHEMVEYLKGKYPTLSDRTLKNKLTPLAEQFEKIWNPQNARRRKFKQPFRIDCICKDCSFTDTLITKEGFYPVEDSEEEKIPVKCPNCEKYCLYNVFWPYDEEEFELDTLQVQESIESFNQMLDRGTFK